MSTMTWEDVAEVLAPGTRVEVRNGFDGSWSKGFEVAAAGERSYELKRLSDGEVLPTAFADDDVRRERRSSSMWWV